jgi:ADP-ribose pyrophosphatase YjhB (NUDIX family)
MKKAQLLSALSSLAAVSLLFVVMASFSFSVSAEWIQVTGKASLNHGRYDLAREQAMKDALRQAVYQYGVNIDSQQMLENGRLKKDSLNLSSRAQVNQSVIHSESEEDGYLFLTLNVDMKNQPLCGGSQASQYKKKVAVLGFSLQVPEQVNLGGLQNIERGLASDLVRQLKERNDVVVYEQSQVAIHADMRNAPSHYTEQLTLTNAADYAKQAGVQFVVSGVIRDLSLEDSDTFSTSYWSTLKRLVNRANPNRHFVVDLFVHDGFSGAIVWQKQFMTTGKWQADLTDKVGFGSPEFLNEDYGQQVAALIQGMAGNVTEQIHCQPFMTRVSRVEGKTLHFSSGASSGIRPGDTLALYRTSNFFDSDRLSGVDLENVKTALTVSQVHPNFASGTISVDPGRLNIQEDDLLIAW